MSKVDSESTESYRPPVEFMEDSKEALVDLNLTNSTELLLFQFPTSIVDVLSVIDGQHLSINLRDYQLDSYKDLNGKEYHFCSFAGAKRTVFISSATEKKIAGNLSRRVTVGHFPNPEELHKLFSTNARHASLSEVSEPSNNPKRNRATESSHDEPSNTPKRNRVTESSHGHGNGISAITYDHSHGGK